MIALALRGMAQRKLRSVLTAIAVVLGVAMVAGTYVQTDQIRGAFDDLTRAGLAGVDVSVTPHTDFEASFSQLQTMDAGTVDRVARVPGVGRAEGQLLQFGSLVVDGRAVEPQYAPAMVLSFTHPPFDQLTLVDGHMPATAGEIAVNRGLAEDEHLRLGQRVGVTTRTGIQAVVVSGIVEYGDAASVGGATLVVARLHDVQRWFALEGRVTQVVAAGDGAASPEVLATRIDAVLSQNLDVATGDETAQDEAREAADAISGFLTPLLLALGGAALLVGAFIIFNTFAITVAQRTREFGLVRALGATRRQILVGVAVEALLIGIAASAVGIVVGLGFATVLSAAFDAAWGMPHGALELAPRTVAISLTVGIGVTLGAALVPALRATRVPPLAALREDAATVAAHPGLRRAASALVGVLGLVLLVQGLLGGGPATARLGAVGAGSVMLFVGVAINARYLVRPLASALGRPLRRIGDGTGELACDNAARHPARTATTAASLMVGLALVVFVAVLASGLRTTIDQTVQARLPGPDLMVSSSSITPMSADAAEAVGTVDGVASASTLLVDQVRVGDERSTNVLTDVLSAVDPEQIGRLYDFVWADGSDADVARLAAGDVLVEQQFAEAHDVQVGDRFRLTTPSGRSAVVRAGGIYEDPAVLQGLIAGKETFAELSTVTDPWIVWVQLEDGADREAVRDAMERALAEYPTAKVRTVEEYTDWATGQIDQIVLLLYALLAFSLVIASFGIANSLFLAIHERTRELGLLRAVGATSGQVRRMIRYESLIIAAVGAVLGTAVGLLFAWLATLALADWGLVFAPPAAQLAVSVVLGLVVGVLGAAAPARRAGRLDVLRSLDAA